jgi:soluble lytic murein transglycosylase-like protein
MTLRGLGTGTISVQQQIAATAQRYGVPPELALAVAKQESGYNQSARGAAGEIGVFQLMPGTAAGLGVDALDLGQNIDGGVRYLAQMLSRYGDPATALEAYNAGPGNVDKGRIPASSRQYAASVLATANMIEPPEPGDAVGGYGAGADEIAPDLPPIEYSGPDMGTIAILAGAGLLLVAAITR